MADVPDVLSPRQREPGASVAGGEPAYATMAILGFLFSWGQFLWPVMVTRGIDVRPLTLGIGTFKSTPPFQWGDIMAYATLMTLPVLLVFVIFQRWFVRGVASTGVKG